MYRNCPKIESWNTFKLDLKNIWHLSEIELYALEVFCQKSKGSRRKTFQWKQVLFVFGTEEVVLMQRIQSNKYTIFQLCAICFYLFCFNSILLWHAFTSYPRPPNCPIHQNVFKTLIRERNFIVKKSNFVLRVWPKHYKPPEKKCKRNIFNLFSQLASIKSLPWKQCRRCLITRLCQHW